MNHTPPVLATVAELNQRIADLVPDTSNYHSIRRATHLGFLPSVKVPAQPKSLRYRFDIIDDIAAMYLTYAKGYNLAALGLPNFPKGGAS